ncbi:MAG: hypothetical protein SH848_14120 [Saprospiraceae bacterium]|nr:hypothetical protein [Saprospiraceae bacterium]
MMAAEFKYKKMGIDWMAEVPEHGEMRRLKYIADVKFSTVEKHSLKEEKNQALQLC